jgi:outer membrane biosynthesis protein TonB
MREMGQGFAGRLVGSGAAHVVVIVLLIVGLPWLVPKPTEPQTISVEIVGDAGAPPPSTRPIPTPPKADKPPTPPKPRPKPPEPKPQPPEPKPPEAALAPKPAPDAVPPPPPKAKPKPKPKPKEPPKPDTEQEFGALLKNLAPDAAPGTRDSKGDNPSARAMDAGEMSALQAQLAQCWNVVAGARDAQTLAVEIEMTINADRTVAQAKIVDSARYGADPAFRAAADSAMRALRHPSCTPLDLPPEKYDAWKHITFVFDPKSLL